QLIAAFRWRPDGSLGFAKCLTAAGDWIGVEPGAASGPWGAGDRVWRLRDGSPWAPLAPLTAFPSLASPRLGATPPLAAPRPSPPGAGTAILDAAAGPRTAQGVARARSRGPYPTEQLSTALLESFRHDPAVPDPAARFMDGDLDWLPAPHERHRTSADVTVQM